MLVSTQSIDQNARNLFLNHAKTNGFALVSDIENTYYAEPLTSLYERFKRGKAGAMTQGRAAAMRAAAELKNAPARVLSFYGALHKQGFKGSTVTHEKLGEAVTIATGKSTKESSIKAAVRLLKAGGWISVHYTPTGTKSEIEPGLWRSLRICQITITEQTKALFSTTCTHKSLPSQKLPAMGCRGNGGEESVAFPPVTQKTNVEILPGRPGRGDTAPKNTVEPTPPAPPSAAPTFAHSPVETKEPAPKAGCFARRKRNRSPKTWDANRLLFLRELAAALTEHPQAEPLYRLAKIQTNKAFPPLIPTALHWEPEIFTYHESNKRNRRRRLMQHIIPALAAFAVGIFPPDTGPLSRAETPPAVKAAIEKQLAAYERLRLYHGSISRRIRWGDYPKEIRDFAAANAFKLDRWASAIQSGRVPVAGVPYEARNLFRELADLVNED